MKNILLSFSFLFIGFYGLGQNQNWKQIGAPDSTQTTIVYFSSQGFIIGYMNETTDLAISKDKGKTWQTFYQNINQGYYYLEQTIEEDKDGNIYFCLQGIIYKLNPSNLIYQKFFESDDYYYEDVEFMDNGNLLVATNREFYLLDQNGKILKEHKWWTHSAKIMPGKGSQKNYVTNSHGASYSMVEFSDELSMVQPEYSIDYFYNIERLGDTLYTDKRYSVDGAKTWKNISYLFGSNVYYKVHIGHDNNLYWVSNDSIYFGSTISKPLSKIFKDEFDLGEILASKDGHILMHSNSCEIDMAKYTDNKGEVWKDIYLKNGLPRTYQFWAGTNESIFARDNCSTYEYKNGTASKWKEVLLPENNFFDYFNILPMSNGEILAYREFGDLLTSNDGGETWKNISTSSNFSDSDIFEKNSTLIQLDYDKLYYSLDFGKSWQNYLLGDNFIFFFSDYGAITKDFSIFYSEFGNFISRYDVKNNYNIDLPIPNDRSLIGMQTSFSSNDLYLLTSIWNSPKLHLDISRDLGLTFDSKIINTNVSIVNPQLFVDHLDNIYIMSEHSLIMSSDQGSNWIDITPDLPAVSKLTNIQVSYDNYIYLSTEGMGVLKYKYQLKEPYKVNVAIYDDLNKNCLRDQNEPWVEGVKVILNENDIRYSSNNEKLSFYTLKNKNIVSIDIDNSLFKSCQTEYTVNIDSSMTTTNLDIPVQTLKYCAYPIGAISADRLRRCFDNTYHGTVCNDGSITSEKTRIVITLDPFFDLISSSLPIVSQIGDELILDAGSIERGKCLSYYIVVNVSCDATLGQEHCIKLKTTTSSATCDDVTTRSEYVECQANIGSYDPNDKTIFVDGSRSAEYVELESKIDYMIRFQNTGTDTAFTVRIEDPISSKFELKSIKPIAASHKYTWSIEGGVLKVVFPNINLVDSFANEPLSHGFIKFSIEMAKETMKGETLTNVAGIFFDFNEPVITNEVVTSVGMPVGTENDDNIIKLVVEPNPCFDVISIRSPLLTKGICKLSLINAYGEVVLEQLVNNAQNTIDVSKLVSGTYIAHIIAGHEKQVSKFVKL